MKKILQVLKKEPMLTVSVAAAVVALFITPPSMKLLSDIDWRTLGTLFMMLTVLEGFKKENIFLPVLKLAGSIKTMVGITYLPICVTLFGMVMVARLVQPPNTSEPSHVVPLGIMTELRLVQF